MRLQARGWIESDDSTSHTEEKTRKNFTIIAKSSYMTTVYVLMLIQHSHYCFLWLLLTIFNFKHFSMLLEISNILGGLGLGLGLVFVTLILSKIFNLT